MLLQCRLFEHGVVIGSLCRPLCVTHEIQSFTCHSFRQGKEAVFSAEWHNTKLVFKAARSAVQNLHWYDNGVKKYPSESDFRSTIRAIVLSKLNVSLSHENAVRLGRLKPSYEELDPVKRQKEMDNLWPLVQDNEYVISALYTDIDIFPQLLGTCGQYFAVEYLDPIQSVSTLLSMSDGRDEWSKRLRLSILIMELVNELDSSFKEPFHLCDVKLSHFGLTKGGSRLKFIDLNIVYPKSVVNKIIKNIGSCKSDDDCDLYDCRGKCDIDTKKCQGAVTNNNVQIVCEKLFLGWTMSNKMIIPGLLMSQHTPSSLASVLRQCANPASEFNNPRSSTPDDIKQRLYNIVVEIEQTVSNDFIL